MTPKLKRLIRQVAQTMTSRKVIANCEVTVLTNSDQLPTYQGKEDMSWKSGLKWKHRPSTIEVVVGDKLLDEKILKQLLVVHSIVR